MEDVSLGTISPGVEGLKDLGASNKAFFFGTSCTVVETSRVSARNIEF